MVHTPVLDMRYKSAIRFFKEVPMLTFVCMMGVCIFAALIASAKKRSVVGWFFGVLIPCVVAYFLLMGVGLGFGAILVTGLILLAVLVCLPSLSTEEDTTPKEAPENMGTCPRCGANVPSTVEACIVCGQDMSEAKARADAARAREEWEQGRRECPHCAEHIKRKAKVCHFCGKDVEPEAYPNAETAQSSPEAPAHS
jgi:hypothetical protein